MSLWPAVRDHAIKWSVGAVGTALVAATPWLYGWFSNVVTKTDLEGSLETFAVMVGEEVRAELAPIVEQQKANTVAICTGKRATLRASVRDLKVELQEMTKERGSSGWDNRDEALFFEWSEDLDSANEELGALNCQP